MRAPGAKLREPSRPPVLALCDVARTSITVANQANTRATASFADHLATPTASLPLGLDMTHFSFAAPGPE